MASCWGMKEEKIVLERCLKVHGEERSHRLAFIGLNVTHLLPHPVDQLTCVNSIISPSLHSHTCRGGKGYETLFRSLSHFVDIIISMSAVFGFELSCFCLVKMCGRL